MTFKFDHSQIELTDAIGISDEESKDLSERYDKARSAYIESIISRALTPDEKGLKLSEIIEMNNSHFTKEELSIIMAITLKNEVIGFFENNKEIIAHLTQAIGNTIIK